MGFTQEKKIDSASCDFCMGCHEHCELGLHYEVRQHGFYNVLHVWPTIGDKTIKKYINKDGVFVIAERVLGNVSRNEEIKSLLSASRIRIIRESRQIATLCDKYKVR